ncbi:MAG: hypothetical protein ABSA18_06635 [Dehalococcoidia bacterium]
MKVTSDKLHARIVQDINKSGFLSELLVAKELVKNRWDVRNSVTFLDKDESKMREIDIIAFHYRFDEPHDLSVEITLAIEVKNGNDKPWLVYTLPVSDSRNLQPASRCILTYVHNLSDIVTHDLLVDGLPRQRCRQVGISYGEAFKKDNVPSQIYTALVKSCKAAQSEVEPLQSADKQLQGLSFRQLAIFQPVVVLNGTLIEVRLSRGDKIRLDERQFIPVTLGNFMPNTTREAFYPDIVTMTGLSPYLRHHAQWARALERNIILRLSNLAQSKICQNRLSPM